MCCPASGCGKSMLVGPTGAFMPTYIYMRNGNQALGILGMAFPASEAHTLYEKFLVHRNRESGLYIVCPSPTCTFSCPVLRFFPCPG